jgi:integrase
VSRFATASDGTAPPTGPNRVRFRDVEGRRRSRDFDTTQDALDFRAHLRLLERRGELASLDAGKQTLEEFMPEWWNLYAKQRLAISTRRTYRSLWNVHLLPRLGARQLRQLTPVVLDQFQLDLERAGVGAPARRKTMALLQRMLSSAVQWGYISANPAGSVTKPTAPRRRAVVALSPAAVERLRLALDPVSALLVSLLSYAGMRPEEALALEWRHIGRSTIPIEQKLLDGRIVVGQKTQRPPRTIDLLGPVREDLRHHQLARGVREGLIFQRADGRPWTDHDYRNWRRRKWQFAAEVAGVGTVVVQRIDGVQRRSYSGSGPYDLRHSFASLLIHEGRLSVMEIAAQLGHSTDTLLRTYAHVIADLRGEPRVSAELAIRQARGQVHAATA